MKSQNISIDLDVEDAKNTKIRPQKNDVATQKTYS